MSNFKSHISHFKLFLNTKRNLIGNWKLEIRKSQTGTTLIELLIYMGLLAIFLSVLTGLFTSIIGVALESRSVSVVEEDGRYILTRITHDIHRATDITTPLLGDQNSTLGLTINNAPFTYTVTNGNLEITENSETNRINSADTRITALSFRRIGNVNGKNTIVVNFTIESLGKKASGEFESKSIYTTVGTR